MSFGKTVYLVMIAMLFFGTGIPFFAKLIDLTPVEGKMFEHPFLQCAIMFVGEALSLVVYKCAGGSGNDSALAVQRQEDWIYQKLGKRCFVLPAIFDIFSSSLGYLAMILTAPSIYQMLRGGSVLVVAFYSLTFLNKKFYKHQCLGLLLTTVGLVTVGVVSVLHKAETAKNPVLGIILAITAQFFSGGNYVVEEKLMQKIDINPLEVVGIEGISGVCIFLIVLPLLNSIPCDSEDLCNGGFIENSLQAMNEISENRIIGLYLFLMMTCLLLFAVTGVYVTKNVSSLATVIVSSCRVGTIWVLSLIAGWEEFLLSELVGFSILILGTMIYNEVIVLSFCGLAKGVNQGKQTTIDAEDIHLKENNYT